MRFHARLVPIPELSASEKAGMVSLLKRHFEGVKPEDFAVDLAEKSWAILLKDGNGAVRGFSTLDFYRTEVLGEPSHVLFSGDTIIDKEVWGSPVPVQMWLRSALGFRAKCGTRLDWLLLVSGYRTYRILTTLFRDVHPDYAGTSPGLRERMDLLARQRFKGLYYPQFGIVKLRHSVHRLRPGVGDIDEARRRNPVISFFERKNPGHIRGDELCCITEVSEENLTPAAHRLLRG